MAIVKRYKVCMSCGMKFRNKPGVICSMCTRKGNDGE